MAEGNNAARGRRKGAVILTRNRQKVLATYLEAADNGERISYSEMARRCHLHCYRKARRTIRDMQRLGWI